MTNFLGLVSTRTVIGVDQSIASLTLGQGFRDCFGLTNVHFVQVLQPVKKLSKRSIPRAIPMMAAWYEAPQ